MNFVQSNLYKDWDWVAPSYNQNIILDTTSDITWDTTPNITLDFIEKYSDKKWDWGSISGNTMEKDKENWINNHRLQIIKAFQIQRHWRNCVSNTEYKLAQKLIKDRLDS